MILSKLVSSQIKDFNHPRRMQDPTCEAIQLKYLTDCKKLFDVLICPLIQVAVIPRVGRVSLRANRSRPLFIVADLKCFYQCFLFASSRLSLIFV